MVLNVQLSLELRSVENDFVDTLIVKIAFNFILDFKCLMQYLQNVHSFLSSLSSKILIFSITLYLCYDAIWILKDNLSICE